MLSLPSPLPTRYSPHQLSSCSAASLLDRTHSRTALQISVLLPLSLPLAHLFAALATQCAPAATSTIGSRTCLGTYFAPAHHHNLPANAAIRVEATLASHMAITLDHTNTCDARAQQTTSTNPSQVCVASLGRIQAMCMLLHLQTFPPSDSVS